MNYCEKNLSFLSRKIRKLIPVYFLLKNPHQVAWTTLKIHLYPHCCTVGLTFLSLHQRSSLKVKEKKKLLIVWVQHFADLPPVASRDWPDVGGLCRWVRAQIPTWEFKSQRKHVSYEKNGLCDTIYEVAVFVLAEWPCYNLSCVMDGAEQH